MVTDLLHERIGEPFVILNAADAARLKVDEGNLVRLIFADQGGETVAPVLLDENLPERVALAPRSFGIPISGPRTVEVRQVERVKA